MNDTNAKDLGWLAFRYVAREMSVAELEQFEERLAMDQTARESVASAFQLTQAVKMATTVQRPAFLERVCLPPAATPVTGKWFRRMGWLSLGAAACLALTWGWQAGRRQDSPLASGSNPENRKLIAVLQGQPDGKLSAVWAGVNLEELGEGWYDEVRQAGGVVVILNGEDARLLAGQVSIGAESTEEDHNADSENTVPEWLLAAVSVKPLAEVPELDESIQEN